MPAPPGPVTGMFPLGASTTASASAVGSRLGTLRFSAIGAALLRAQLAGAALGLDLAGALRR
jgi:hypothetical protein